jgi:hypothetical protein
VQQADSAKQQAASGEQQVASSKQQSGIQQIWRLSRSGNRVLEESINSNEPHGG